MADIILNRIKCNNCGDILTSHTTHDYRECDCGDCAVDGGRMYLKRKGNNYTDLTVMSDAPFEIIREAYYRGTRGPNNDGPLTLMLLCDMSDAHLENTIAYIKRGAISKQGLQIYLDELEYRIKNSIFIGDKS